MSKKFAVINGDTVINVIVANTKKVAEQVTGFECVECDGSFWIDWKREGDLWIAPAVKVVDETQTL